MANKNISVWLQMFTDKNVKENQSESLKGYKIAAHAYFATNHKRDKKSVA